MVRAFIPLHVYMAHVLRQARACTRHTLPKERMSPKTSPYLTLTTMAKLLLCARRGRDTHPRIHVTRLVAQRSSKAHMRTTKRPSTWHSTVPMNKPLSLARYNYRGACKMHTCSSGKCQTQIYHEDGGHTIGNKHHHHFPPPQWLPPPLPTQTPAHEPAEAINVDAPASFVTHHGYITPAISGAHLWAEWLHHPCLLRVPIVGRNNYGVWNLGKNG